ncbi:MAG: 2-oxoacid:acceptor oxidoreductase subunit alpha [Thermoanaerobacteraceae bacterium]|nr:2-oxoacid:acceptor oxidoreductase subunit alpha [Thermoanaerobacteraceae bacterium]
MAQEGFIQGNEACARGAIAAGARFFAGYPISPASEIAEVCSELMPQVGGHYVQMEDEIASIAAVIGASLTGTKAFTATSGPGFSLMQENIGLAIMAEVPCVIINAQRFGLSTGVATKPAQGDVMQARWGTHGDHAVITLAPTTVQECFDLTVTAFNLAERFRSPVFLFTDAATAHLREKIIIKEPGELEIINRKPAYNAPEEPYVIDDKQVSILPNYGDSSILRVTGLVHDSRGFSSSDPEIATTLTRRLIAKIEDYQNELPQPVWYGTTRPQVLIISYGIVTRAARAAMERLIARGLEVGVMSLPTLWPFPQSEVARACSRARWVFVPEMNYGQIAREVRAASRATPVFGIYRTDTNILTPNDIIAEVKKVVGLK